MLIQDNLAEYSCGVPPLVEGLNKLVALDADHRNYRGPVHEARPRDDFRALTTSQNMLAMATYAMARRVDSFIIEDTGTTRIRGIQAPRLKHTPGRGADNLYQEFTSTDNQTARERAKQYLFRHIAACDPEFGPEAEYLIFTQPQTRVVPARMKYMWSEYKPMEAERFIRLSEVDHRIFKDPGHEQWKT
jgi:hypothetical protein